MQLYKYICFLVLLFALFRLAFAGTTIDHQQGDVFYRRGLEEEWRPARNGVELKEIDTILTREGRVVLKRSDGSTFTLDSHSILDISELRTITREDMFLYVMSQKVEKMKSRQNSELEVGNATAVHGEKKTVPREEPAKDDTPSWELEFNAAKAMYAHSLMTNTVVKLHKMLNRYSDISDCGKTSLYLGKAFEKLDERGQAIDHYNRALEKSKNCQSDVITREAKQAVKRLSH